MKLSANIVAIVGNTVHVAIRNEDIGVDELLFQYTLTVAAGATPQEIVDIVRADAQARATARRNTRPRAQLIGTRVEIE